MFIIVPPMLVSLFCNLLYFFLKCIDSIWRFNLSVSTWEVYPLYHGLLLRVFTIVPQLQTRQSDWCGKNLSMHDFSVGELLHMCSPCPDVVYLRTVISNPVDDQVSVLLAVECVSQSQV